MEKIVDETGDSSNNGDDHPVAKRPCRKLEIKWREGRDIWWHEIIKDADTTCEPEWLDAETPLFMLYTR